MFMNSLIHLLEAVTLLLVGVLIVQVYRCYLNFNRAAVAQAKVGRSFSLQINIPSRLAEPRIGSSKSAVLAKTMLEKAMISDASTADTNDGNTAVGNTQSAVHNGTRFQTKLDAESESSSVSDNANDQILNDYIGGFFAEAVQPDIAAFRNEVSEVPAVSKLETACSKTELSSQSSLNEAPALSTYSSDESLHSDEVITVESAASLNDPAIVDDLVDQLDDLSNGLESIPVLTNLSHSTEDDDSVIVVIDERGVSSSSDKIMSDKVVHAMLDEARLVCAS